MIHAFLLALLIGVGIRLGQRLVHGPKPLGRVVPGWYPDPYEEHRLRYWDGGTWTGHTDDGSRE